jgi:hypothetical protein
MPTGDTIRLPLAGGCQCGAVRYAVKSAPVAFYWCHCTECQRPSGAAFGEPLRVRRTDVDITGTLHQWSRKTEFGTVSETAFCPVCATRIWHTRPNAEFCHLRAGTLDDTSWLVPAAHIWTRSRQPGVHIDPDALVYPMNPDGLDAIIARFARMMAGRFAN